MHFYGEIYENFPPHIYFHKLLVKFVIACMNSKSMLTSKTSNFNYVPQFRGKESTSTNLLL